MVGYDEEEGVARTGHHDIVQLSNRTLYLLYGAEMVLVMPHHPPAGQMGCEGIGLDLRGLRGEGEKLSDYGNDGVGGDAGLDEVCGEHIRYAEGSLVVMAVGGGIAGEVLQILEGANLVAVMEIDRGEAEIGSGVGSIVKFYGFKEMSVGERVVRVIEVDYTESIPGAGHNTACRPIYTGSVALDDESQKHDGAVVALVVEETHSFVVEILQRSALVLFEYLRHGIARVGGCDFGADADHQEHCMEKKQKSPHP